MRDPRGKRLAVKLPDIAELVLPLSRPSLRIHTATADDDLIPTGRSKIGGRPDLSPDLEWPRKANKPLSFLAQLNLRDLQQYEVCRELPSSGILEFFYETDQSAWGFDPKDRGSWRVLFMPETDSVRRIEAPDGLEESGRFQSCEIECVVETTLCPWESRDFEGLGLSQPDKERYFEFLDSLEEEEDAAPVHRVLGHPDIIQGEMQLECQLVSNGIYCGEPSGYEDPRAATLSPGAGKWKLLLQLDSDDSSSMMWGDCGRLYFWIREASLRDLEFGDAWMILQCG